MPGLHGQNTAAAISSAASSWPMGWLGCQENGGGTPPQITSHPIKCGSGDWTCVIGEFANGARMVTVAKWRDGAIAEEYIWS